MKCIAGVQAAVQADRAKFIYKWKFKGRSAASRIVLDNMCHFVGKFCDTKSGKKGTSKARRQAREEK
jgi:hypothetical protein